MINLFKNLVLSITFASSISTLANESKVLPFGSTGSVMADKIEYFLDSLVGNYIGEGIQKIKINDHLNKENKLNGKLVVDDDFNRLAWYFDESIVRIEDRSTSKSSLYFQLNNGLLYVGKGDAPQYCQVNDMGERLFECEFTWKNPPNRNYKNKIMIT